MKIDSVGNKIFHVDEGKDGQMERQTDRNDKANSPFRNFVNASKSQSHIGK